MTCLPPEDQVFLILVLTEKLELLCFGFVFFQRFCLLVNIRVIVSCPRSMANGVGLGRCQFIAGDVQQKK